MKQEQQTRIIPQFFKEEVKKKKAVEEKKFELKKVEVIFDGIKTERISVLPDVAQ